LRGRPGQDGTAVTFVGYAKLNSPHTGLVSITTLFGEVASAMQDSDDPDPAPHVRGLPLMAVSLVKVSVPAGVA